MRTQFITAAEVEKALGVSRSKAYQIIRTLNRELRKKRPLLTRLFQRTSRHIRTHEKDPPNLERI